jgi:hypothetical protein
MPHYIMNAAWEVSQALRTYRDPLQQVPAGRNTPLRSKFALTENSAFVYELGASVPLPSRRVSYNGRAFRITELPGPALDGDKAHKDTFEIRIEGDVVDCIHITYKASEALIPSNSDYSFTPAEVLFDQVLDEMVFITRNILKVDQSRVDALFWKDVLDTLKREYSQDPAKYALIAELAQSIVPTLERIAGSPKKALRRIRDQERIQSVRELDKHCLIDLARRPGASLPEKAGPRQRVLSIKRYESVDTLENQVFLNCCNMLDWSSKRYLSIYRGVAGSKRKQLVEGLSRCCRRLKNEPSLKRVSRLKSPCRQPNYVLLQNVHYAKIWKAYTQLLRNEQLRDSLWRWSRRLYADYLAINLADVIERWFNSISVQIAMPIVEKVVQAQTWPRHGSWLLPDVLPGPLVLGINYDSTGTLYAIDGAFYESLGDFAAPLGILNADFLLVWLTENERSVLPIYVNLFDPREDFEAAISQTSADLLVGATTFNSVCKSWRCVGAWVFHGIQMDSRVATADQISGQHVTCWQSFLKANVSGWIAPEEGLFAALSWLTGIGLNGNRN